MNGTTMEALARALVHFTWQGAAIGLAAAIAGATLRRARAQARYAVFCAALALMASAPILTFAFLRFTPPRPPAAPMATRVGAASPAPTAALAQMATTPLADPAWRVPLVVLWLAGVSALSARSLVGWVQLQRMTRRSTLAAPEALRRVGEAIASRLSIRRPVRILSTAAVEVPAALGWVRPVVLLPISAVTALTPEQIELLILHELAHVRRHDYLVNLAQAAIENLLFYHPAVWWVSDRIRAEREHCCDDLAVATCGDPAGYARALATLEETRIGHVSFALSARGGSLVARVERLLRRGAGRRETLPMWLPALVPAAVIVASVLTLAPPGAQSIAATKPAGTPNGFLAGLADAGYTQITVDEIIALKEHGVTPRYIKGMTGAGLGTLGVKQLIELYEHGVEPDYATRVVESALVRDLDVGGVIRLRENGVSADDMAAIRALGYGPYSLEEIIRLRHNDVGAQRIRSMKDQGFGNMTVEQMIKLRQAGII